MSQSSEGALAKSEGVGSCILAPLALANVDVRTYDVRSCEGVQPHDTTLYPSRWLSWLARHKDIRWRFRHVSTLEDLPD